MLFICSSVGIGGGGTFWTVVGAGGGGGDGLRVLREFALGPSLSYLSIFSLREQGQPARPVLWCTVFFLTRWHVLHGQPSVSLSGVNLMPDQVPLTVVSTLVFPACFFFIKL